MNTLLRDTIRAAIWVVLGSSFVFGIVRLEASLPAKALIAVTLSILVILLNVLWSIGDELRRLLYFLRVTYVSVETKRLDPQDARPSRDILAGDVANEKGEKINSMLTMSPFSEVVVYGVFLALVACGSWVLLRLWP